MNIHDGSTQAQSVIGYGFLFLGVVLIAARLITDIADLGWASLFSAMAGLLAAWTDRDMA
jgi:hypothetical protein